MLKKTPKSSFRGHLKTVAKVAFVAEAIAFFGSYIVWHRLNTDRDFRYYMHQKYNWVLKGYYYWGEKLANDNTRESDFKIWDKEGRL